MNTGDRYDARHAHGGRDVRSSAGVPRPAGPRSGGSRPADPPSAPGGAVPPSSPTEDWLAKERPEAGPGVWRYGYEERSERAEEQVSDRSLLAGAVITLLSGALLWSLLRNNYLPYWRVPLQLFTPSDWWEFGAYGGYRTRQAYDVQNVYLAVLCAGIIYWFAQLGNWAEFLRRFVVAREQPARAVLAGAGALVVQVLVITGTLPFEPAVLGLLPTAWHGGGGDPALARFVSYSVHGVLAVVFLLPFLRLSGLTERLRGKPRQNTAPAAPPPPPAAPARWPELRAAGLGEAADLLTAELRQGRMNDLDVVRVRAAWDAAADDPGRREHFAATVLRDGAAAFVHPSGARDLPRRTARHDLLAGQVRIGRYADGEPNPYRSRGVGVALEPAVLGTSLLAVGPPGAGKTRGLTAPVVESLALQALAGKCAVLAVCAAGTPLADDEAYDVVVRVGDPASVHDLDLYGGTTDPEAASAVLAEALVGDLDTVDTGRAATALAQLIGPYRTVRDRFPAVPELYELLRADPAALQRLAADLDAAGQSGMLRDLSSRVRQMGTAADPCPALADRLALLDRPAFADFFATDPAARPFSLRALQRHPMRVRVELPEQRYAEASRLLARLVLAQFLTAVTARADRSLFACLVLDDATATLTPDTVRGIGRLRSANAGVVLSLRTVDDVPEALHIPLLGAVGCHMAFSGVTTWDGRRFTEVWGTEWVETTEVAQHTVFANQPFTRAVHALRKLVTGKAVVTRAVTVKKVERERWSASELARGVPAGHAVLSLTTVAGEHAPPLLLDLGD